MVWLKAPIELNVLQKIANSASVLLHAAGDVANVLFVEIDFEDVTESVMNSPFVYDVENDD